MKKSEFRSEMKHLEDQIEEISFISQETRKDEKILQKRCSHQNCDAFTSGACAQSWWIQ